MNDRQRKELDKAVGALLGLEAPKGVRIPAQPAKRDLKRRFKSLKIDGNYRMKKSRE